MDAIGRRIRKLRTQLGMTQKQLADGICTKSFISLLEQGRAQASLKTLHLIAERLGVTAAELMGPGEPVAPLAWIADALRDILGALDAGDPAGARRKTLLALGWVCEQIGDQEGALEAYRRAAEMAVRTAQLSRIPEEADAPSSTPRKRETRVDRADRTK